MKKLRSHKQVDTLQSLKGADPIRWGRRIYFAICIGLAIALANYFVGDILVLRAQGLVVSDRYVVSATYTAKVASVRVKPGQVVKAGDPLLEFESIDILKDIATLATQNADLAAREAQLSVQAEMAQELMPIALRHAEESRNASMHVATMAERGLASSRRVDEALGSKFETASRLAELQSRSGVLSQQLPLVREARSRAQQALQRLEATYEHGIVRADRDGVVGPHVPTPGQVVKLGDELMKIHGANVRTLAYLPDDYLFRVEPGDRVVVSGRTTKAVGTVEAVLSVTDALPPEFQNMFRPRDRSRLLRVNVPDLSDFAVEQKVSVTGCAFGLCWADLVVPTPPVRMSVGRGLTTADGQRSADTL